MAGMTADNSVDMKEETKVLTKVVMSAVKSVERTEKH